MRRLLLLLLVLGLLLGLVIVAARNHGGAGALDDQDIASLIVKIGALVLVGGAVLTMFRSNFSKSVEYLLIWVVIGLMLVLGYTYRFDLKDIGDRVMAELMPGRAASKGRVVAVSYTHLTLPTIYSV